MVYDVKSFSKTSAILTHPVLFVNLTEKSKTQRGSKVAPDNIFMLISI